MQKHRWDDTTIGTYWTWEMPELARELPILLQKAGRVEILSEPDFLTRVVIRVHLHQPAKVIDWGQNWGDGVAINSATYACFSRGFSANMKRLPREGDTVIELDIELEMRTFKEGQEITLDDMRKALHEFAEQITKTWYYH